jgi:hypothetical protein
MAAPPPPACFVLLTPSDQVLKLQKAIKVAPGPKLVSTRTCHPSAIKVAQAILDGQYNKPTTDCELSFQLGSHGAYMAAEDFDQLCKTGTLEDWQQTVDSMEAGTRGDPIGGSENSRITVVFHKEMIAHMMAKPKKKGRRKHACMHATLGQGHMRAGAHACRGACVQGRMRARRRGKCMQGRPRGCTCMHATVQRQQGHNWVMLDGR